MEQTAQRYRLKDAAKYILMSTTFLRKAHKNGTGPDRIRSGSKVIIFEKSALDAWLESRKEVSTSPNP
jgi:predicted DNA-binding transcriptional regulator AlpA